jgi:hypothetical protein
VREEGGRERRRHMKFDNDVFVTNVGSLAKFKKRQTFSIDPFSSKSCLKNLAVSILTYHQ